ncbi:hypothetical protein CIB84_008627 [Bambusicola thoracicus]|uniref:Uncharacterized protein n=1 Tax=Bambusicola thoracicus TaxID=9083 RepID=A0A2P4SU29_BAMTH|nr:hypothetical protein CIB84_008627 [Bambusicola thoracicus]
MYQDYPGSFDTSSRGSSGSPGHPEPYSAGAAQQPISIAGGYYGEEALNTPIVVTSTPAITPGSSNLVFTYPNVLDQESPLSPSESCSKAHRRSSSSGDQSSDSLNSPTLLAL